MSESDTLALQCVGRILKPARLMAGKGMRQFAQEIGLLPSRISEIETGSAPTAAELKLMADALEAARREGIDWRESTVATLAARESELAAETRRVENVMAERDRWSGLYSRLQDERAADFAKWFKIINFGGLTEYQAECPQVIDSALRELTSWRWLAEMLCTVQAMASTIPDLQCWVVLDVDGEALGEGETPIAAIEDARKNFLPPDRITHIPGKEDHDGEMH